MDCVRSQVCVEGDLIGSMIAVIKMTLPQLFSSFLMTHFLFLLFSFLLFTLQLHDTCLYFILYTWRMIQLQRIVTSSLF
jgi:hypothetical protein